MYVIFIFITYLINFYTIVAFTSGTSSSFENSAKPFSYGNPIENFKRQKYLKEITSNTGHDAPSDLDFPVLTSLPISLNELGSHIANYSNKFEDQYLVSVYRDSYKVTRIFFIIQRLYTGNDRPCTVGYMDENKHLNRFQQITVCMLKINLIVN